MQKMQLNLLPKWERLTNSSDEETEHKQSERKRWVIQQPGGSCEFPDLVPHWLNGIWLKISQMLLWPFTSPSKLKITDRKGSGSSWERMPPYFWLSLDMRSSEFVPAWV